MNGMQKDLANLLEVSYTRGFNQIIIKTNSTEEGIKCLIDDIYIDETGISVVDKNHAVFINYNSLVSVEVT